VVIRPRRRSDSPALEAIARLTHEYDGYPKYLPDDLVSFIVDEDALAAWVAEVDGEVAGQVALHPRSVPEIMDLLFSATGLKDGDVAVIARLLVSPNTRGRGIGRALLDRATAEATTLGRRAVLDVVDQHRAAITLYERSGWVRVGRVDWSLPDGRPLREFVYVSPEPERP
jgi:ribosomal protein S18 acetylase RimI-like enzyme